MNTEVAQAPNAMGIKHMLAESDINITRQRLRIAAILLSAPLHLSAEQLLGRLRREGERVSKATVYNTLKLFVDRGLVRRINLDPERTVYDSTCTAHHHFHDVDTGALWDIDPQEVRFSHLPPLPDGMQIAGVEVIIRVMRKGEASPS